MSLDNISIDFLIEKMNILADELILMSEYINEKLDEYQNIQEEFFDVKKELEKRVENVE